jgi:hypothetical protein
MSPLFWLVMLMISMMISVKVLTIAMMLLVVLWVT